MINKSSKIKTVLCVLISFLLCFAACAAFLVKKASALPLSHDITVVSANVYKNNLQVQCRINSKDSDTKTYKYHLFYSKNKADLEGEEIADTISNVEIVKPAAGKVFSQTVVDLVSVTAEDTIYFVVCSTETTVESGEKKKTYTSLRFLKQIDTSDTDQEYFMDCGSDSYYSFENSSEACLTENQSVTWQVFGADALTGKKWGVETGVQAGVSATDKSLLGSSLISTTEQMSFKFEVGDHLTQYDVVMGFKDQSSSRINSAGDIYVNGDFENKKASYMGGYNATVVSFTDVAAVGDASNGYFLAIQVKKAEDSKDLPMCNFISIRKKSAAEAKFITGGHVEINVKNGTKASEMPNKLEIYTTKGSAEADVKFLSLTDRNLSPEENSFSEITRQVEVTYNEKKYEMPATIVIWTAKDVYYFVDCGQSFPFTASAGKFDYAKKEYVTLLNRDQLDREAAGSNEWGYFGATPASYWGNVNSYQSIHEGSNFNVVYNFPSLPKGNYTLDVGVNDPWGPRTSRIYVNDQQIDYMTTKTGQKVQKQIKFTQTEDNAPIVIKVSGATDKPMVGWMMVAYDSELSSSATVDDNKGGSVANLVLVIVLPVVILMLGAGACIFLLKKYKKN